MILFIYISKAVMERSKYSSDLCRELLCGAKQYEVLY